MSKIFIGIHLVFATRYRKRTIDMNRRRELYAYIYTMLQERGCKTYRINGIGDHLHIAFSLNPLISLSDLVRDLKRSTSLFLNSEKGFAGFEGWSKGYFAASFSYEERDTVISYIIDQEKHHLGKHLQAEMEWLALKAGLQFHQEDME